MKHQSLDEMLRLNWVPVLARDEHGYRLTVKGLTDFELFSDSEEELMGGWREALASHLGGYLACGKTVPVPAPTVSLVGDDDGTSGAGDTFRGVFSSEGLALA